MEQNKTVIAILGVATIILFIAVVALGLTCITMGIENQTLSQERSKMAELIQVEEDALILLDDWYKEDGYEDAATWWKDFEEAKAGLAGLRQGVESGENAVYAIPEQLDRLSTIENEAKEIRSVKKLKQLREEYDEIVQAVADASTAAEAYVTYTYSSGGGSSYDTPSDGLTMQSGVNYYDGRTETYYSSNVAYHYRTSEWTVDNEGFYRDSDGYYVVAASDKAEGSTYEGSKGQVRVYDGGCDEGVTDYYVAW